MEGQITLFNMIDDSSLLVFSETDPNNEQEEDVSPNGIDSINQMAISGTDWTTETIVRQIEKGNIILNPDFQRREAWTPTKKSRFIESLFLGFPIPQIVLAENREKKGKFLVIDGKQRLLSLQQFIREDSSKPHTLKLSGLEIKKDLNGKSYKQMIEEGLDADIDALSNQPIRTIVVKNWPSVEVLYLIFLRLNTGSVKLSPQELRQALYPGEFIKYANKAAAESRGIRRILKLKEGTLDFRMRDVELLIRYIAFQFFIDQYHGSMQSFLDKACEQLNKSWDSLRDNIEEKVFSFEQATECVYQIFRDNAFCKFKDKKYESRINRAIMDIMLYYFAQEDIRKAALANSDNVRKEFETLCTEDVQFLDAVEQTTKSILAVNYRFKKWSEMLQQCLEIPVQCPIKET